MSTSGDLDYIAMECVQGHTLAELIGRRPLTVQDTLKYGVQAADALAAAHGAGILHRDLKPGNVMVTETGLVKVLDFGLAKLIEPQAPDPSQPTQTLRADAATEKGQILGTAAYMAPEQVEGKKVDARTDVFAFGILLYEMLTGKRVFERPSRISTLSAVLQEQPPAITDPAIPAELLRVVTRCLRKEPESRYQTMRDVRNALDEIAKTRSPAGSRRLSRCRQSRDRRGPSYSSERRWPPDWRHLPDSRSGIGHTRSPRPRNCSSARSRRTQARTSGPPFPVTANWSPTRPIGAARTTWISGYSRSRKARRRSASQGMMPTILNRIFRPMAG